MGDYLLLHVIGTIFAYSSLVSSDELLVVGETEELLITPSLVVKVKGSPRLKQDLTTLCERIHIYGRPRFKHINKYAHSLNLMVNVSTGDKTSTTHVCFHMNFSLGIGMCLHNQWEKVSNGSWFQTMSPFDHKILDVRIARSSMVTMKVSTVEEFHGSFAWWRSTDIYNCYGIDVKEEHKIDDFPRTRTRDYDEFLMLLAKNS